MPQFHVMVSGRFAQTPREDQLAAIHDALGKHGLGLVRDGSGDFEVTGRVIADHESGAELDGYAFAARALFDGGFTVDTAPISDVTVSSTNE